jgi:hypothetical protein
MEQIAAARIEPSQYNRKECVMRAIFYPALLVAALAAAGCSKTDNTANPPPAPDTSTTAPAEPATPPADTGTAPGTAPDSTQNPDGTQTPGGTTTP